MFKSPSSSSYNLISDRAKVEMFTTRNIQSFTFQIFGVVSLSLNLLEKPGFLASLGFDIQRYSVHETPNIKLYSVRAFKRYLNKKHGREIATISKFSALGLKHTSIQSGCCIVLSLDGFMIQVTMISMVLLKQQTPGAPDNCFE